MDERKSFLKLSQGGFRWGAAVKFTDLCPSLDRTWVQAKTQSTSFPKDFWHFTGLLSRWCTLKCSLVCHGWWVIRCYKEGARHHDWQLSPALAGVLARPWDRGSKCWALLHRHQLQRGQDGSVWIQEILASFLYTQRKVEKASHLYTQSMAGAHVCTLNDARLFKLYSFHVFRAPTLSCFEPRGMTDGDRRFRTPLMNTVKWS